VINHTDPDSEVTLDALHATMSNVWMLRAALLDVGGTLWPDKMAPRADYEPCLREVGRLLPGVDPRHALSTLRTEIQAGLARSDATRSYVQDTHGLVIKALCSLGVWRVDLDTNALRKAVCPAAVPGVGLFPGATELLQYLKSHQLRTVVVSNVQVRGAAEYWTDFADLGVAHLLDAVITSVDVGFRKPHPAVFEAAMVEAGCEPRECVMIGNSEEKDIEPAVAHGMRTIRVAIEEPSPERSSAEAVVGRLNQTREILDRWIIEGDVRMP
jgi:FMN phosphatase YigB (HAD superfamily)